MITRRTLFAACSATAVVTALATSHNSFAGMKLSGTKYNVQISTASSLAVGSLAEARLSSDANEYIGCTMQGQSLIPAGNVVLCEANTSTNTYKMCTTTAPWAIAAVSALNNNSVLQFQWDSAGTCTEIDVRNDSAFPIVP